MTGMTAVISPDGLYRYRLTRTWDYGLPPMLFVMLNPSTADAYTDDPTIRRCIGFAKRWGWGSMTVVNLFAYRTRRPAALRMVEDPVGPDNDEVIAAAAAAAGLVVVAWGTHGCYRRRDRRVLKALTDAGVQPRSIGAPTGSGFPPHPLYLPGALTPRRYP